MAASNTPQKLALTVYQGEPFALALTFRDAAGALIDLTGYQAHMQARDYAAAPDVRADWSSVDGELVPGGATGVLTFDIPESAVNALATDNMPHEWEYDLFLIEPGGRSRKAVVGKLTLVPRVTRA